MDGHTKMTFREKMIGLGILIAAVLVIKFADTVAKILWALLEGAAAIKG